MRGFLAARAIAGVELVAADRYVRSFDGGVVEIRPAEGGVRIDDVAAAARVRHVFGLELDLPAISAHLARDPVMAALIARRPGLRPPGGWDGFELAMRAVLGQQITVASARALAGRLALLCGAPIDLRGLTRVFPTPAQVLAADLAALGMPGSRRATIKAVAEAALGDAALFAPHDDLDVVLRRLTAIKGVGPWTAQYIALRGLRHADAFPAGDVGLLRTMTRLDGTARDPKALLARAERWRPYRAFAAQHLWAADAGAPERD